MRKFCLKEKITLRHVLRYDIISFSGMVACLVVGFCLKNEPFKIIGGVLGGLSFFLVIVLINCSYFFPIKSNEKTANKAARREEKK